MRWDEMPQKPLSACKYQYCDQRTPETYCEKHKGIQHKAYDAQRGSSSERGYDARWQKIRRLYLQTQPLCEDCLARGRTTAASEVHHVIPLRDGGSHAEENLRALCKSCHSTRTAKGE